MQVIINGVERFEWQDGYYVLDGYGYYVDSENKGSPMYKRINLADAGPAAVAARAANRAIKKMIRESK